MNIIDLISVFFLLLQEVTEYSKSKIALQESSDDNDSSSDDDDSSTEESE